MHEADGVPAGRPARLAEILERRSLEAVWLARPANFAWLTGGDNVVDRSGETGVAAAGFDGETVRVVTNDIEADRLREEELPGGVPVEVYPWHASSLAEAVADRSPTPAAADFEVPGFEALGSGAFRQPLADGDRRRYRELGAAVASALEATCRSARPGSTERALAGDLRCRLAHEGISAPVVLVGGADRARSYRHYTPSDAELGAYALVSVTAERGGLFASCTRTVAFDPPEWLAARHRAAARVEATALAATREAGRTGGTAADVFEAIQSAYAAVGWPEEWRRHHQGGAAGFAGREWIATPESGAAVRLPTGYAWNPTVAGAKSEGTVLVTEGGYDPLTDGEWPTVSVDAVGYDEGFDRPAVLRQ